MRCILKNAKVFSQGVFHLADVFLSDGKIVSIGNGVSVPMILLLLIFQIWFYFPVSLMFMFIFESRDFLIKRPSAPARWLPRTAASPTLPLCRT